MACRGGMTAWARLVWAALVAVLICAPAGAAADVVDSAAGGFTLKTTVQVATPPARTYQALLDIGSWWNKDHTYSGDAKNLSIAAQPGGCYCEKLPDGGAVEHGRVVNLVPGSLLRLQTALGPLQELGVTGSMTWQVAASGQGSTVTMTYVVGGYAPGGLQKLAPLVDQVLAQQVQNLKAFLDKSR
ncbi:MAG TPA: SRPBCC family protein [Vicinamibacterales bacterium]|nr:SRPBCC family protein [Vicinamibacterales bacterium]